MSTFVCGDSFTTGFAALALTAAGWAAIASEGVDVRPEPRPPLPPSVWPRTTDYTVISWLDGFPGRIHAAPWQRCIRTGHYAFVLDTAAMTVPHMGPVAASSYSEAVHGDPALIKRLPPADLGLEVRVSGTTYRCTAGRHWGSLSGPRLVESGRWFQRADVDGLDFTAAGGATLRTEGRFETVAWPERLSLLLAVRPGLETIPRGEACFGKIGGGFGLDGGNHLDMPHDATIDPARFTLELWVYVPDDAGSATKAYPWLACKNGHEQADGNYGLSVMNGAPQARLNIGGGRDNAFSVSAKEKFAYESWNHVAMTYDGETLRLFLNGKPQGEQRIGRERRPGRQGLAFGRRQDNSGDGYHFRGAIDEIHLYDTPLSSEQIGERFATPDKLLADVRPVLARVFRAEGQAAATRPREAWHDAGLVLRLTANGTTLERRAEIPATLPADGWHQVAIEFDPAAIEKTPESMPPQGEADPPSVTIEAVPATAAGAPKPQPLSIDVDAARGWHRIDLDPVVPIVPAAKPAAPAAGAAAADPRNDSIERVRLRLANPADREQTLRLLLEKRRLRPGIGSPITGMSAILRDAAGEPTGIPVQLSKNWHSGRGGDPYAGQWFHGFTQLRLPAKTTVDLEFVLAYGHWGGVAAASHAQLCLLGWGSNQLWEESALGSWGESICYEPDQVQAKASILDVRPAMVTSVGNGQPWQWTRNVGGGDFFRLFDRDGQVRPHASMKSGYERQGPCLTEVTHAGKIGTAIDHSEMVSLARTDDIVRGTYRIRMDVRTPVEFSRFVLFQIGADSYSYAHERRMAIGDASGLGREWGTQWGGDTYHTEPLECGGETPWVSLHEAVASPDQKAGGLANRGLVIRRWRAVLGGREAGPFVAEHGTPARVNPSSTIDIVPPPGVDRLEPGDFVEATIEHLVLPATAADYYGPDEPLRTALRQMENTWRMVHREAAGNDRHVDVTCGTLLHRHPDVRMRTDGGRAELRLHGGVGHVPFTFAGLGSHRCGRLEIDGQPIDQSVHGGDFWQTDYDPESGTWSQTFTVPLHGDGPHSVTFRQ